MEFFEQFLEKYCYVTVSQQHYFKERLWELAVERGYWEKILQEWSPGPQKKENTKKLIQMIESWRNPIQVELERDIKAIEKKLKYSGISLSIPPNLEGEGITVTLTLKNKQQSDEILKFLHKNHTTVLELVRLFQTGDE